MRINKSIVARPLVMASLFAVTSVLVGQANATDVLLSGSIAAQSSSVHEYSNVAGLQYEVVRNNNGSVTFTLIPELFDNSPYLQSLVVGISNQAETFSLDLTYGSSDGTPPVDELISMDGGTTYQCTVPSCALEGELGIFYCVNGRAPDNGNDLQRWIGITAMTTANDFGGFDFGWSNRLKINVPECTVSADDSPASFTVAQNYPNPFNPSTVIAFNLAETSAANLSVYDLAGRKVATLVDGMMERGTHNVTFDAGQLASGLYFYTLTANGQALTQKMVLVR
jgi:hypothetical protein